MFDVACIVRTKHRDSLNALVGSRTAMPLSGYPHDLALGEYMKSATKAIQSRWWRQLSKQSNIVHLTGHHWIPPLRKSFVATVHDVFPITMPELVRERDRKRVQRALIQQLEQAAAVLVPSAYTAEEIAQIVPTASDKLTVTPLAAGPEFHPTTQLAEQQTFLWYGRADDRKNVQRMLRAYATLPLDIRRNLRFTIAMGGVAQLREAFANNNAALLNTEGVHFVGPLPFDELISLMQQCYGLIFCSTDEGFGLPVIEAMQCACPVLTSNTTSLPEVGGDAVLYANPYDEHSIAEQMYRLATDAQLRHELRHRGVQRAARFSWQRTVDATIDVYHSVLALQ
jgi:glycosyltransferase involved in cell wall biosynthesis